MENIHRLPSRPLLSLALPLLLAATASAVELPGGSSAQIKPTDTVTAGSGFVVLASGSGRQEYYLAVDALVGIQPKPNGSGSVLLIRTDSAVVQQTEVATPVAEILAAVRLARAPRTP